MNIVIKMLNKSNKMVRFTGIVYLAFLASQARADVEVQIKNQGPESVNLTLRCLPKADCNCNPNSPRYSGAIAPAEIKSLKFNNSCVIQYFDFWNPPGPGRPQVSELGRITLNTPASVLALAPVVIGQTNQQWNVINFCSNAQGKGCCPSGRTFNPDTKKCCEQGQVYSNPSNKPGAGSCCPQGSSWDPSISLCCSADMFNTKTKQCCPQGQIFVPNDGVCCSSSHYDKKSKKCFKYGYSSYYEMPCPEQFPKIENKNAMNLDNGNSFVVDICCNDKACLAKCNRPDDSTCYIGQ